MIEQLFRRHFWVLHLIFLALAAWILAASASPIIAYILRKSLPAPADQGASATAPIQPTKTKRNFDIANERNLFGARREAIEEVKAEQLDPAEHEHDDRASKNWRDAVPSNLPLKLVATVVFPGNPYASLASLLDSESGQVKLYSIKTCRPDGTTPCKNLPGMAELVRIEPDRVYLYNKREHRYETVGAGLAKEERIVLPTQEQGEEEEISGASEEEGVRQTKPDSYQIDSGFLNQTLQKKNLSKILTQAYARFTGGGLVISRIKSGSIFEKIGLQNRDIILKINGNEITPLTAMQLFNKLKRKKHFTIDIKRGESSRTFDYSVVP